MRLIGFGFICFLFFGSCLTFGNELDKEPVNVEMRSLAKDLPATVVVRSDDVGNVAVFHSNDALDKSETSQNAVLAASFTPIKRGEMMKGTVSKSELDSYSSTGSWYFSFGFFPFFYGGFGYPNYYYYGYNYAYSPFWGYPMGGYYYNYYRWWW